MADDDGECFDNWEEQADSGVLDKRLEVMTIDMEKQAKTKKQVVSVLSADDGPTQYQPQVRILKRDNKAPVTPPPKNNVNTEPTAVPPSQSKHSKSLQQREAEYAQARLRIFGCLPPPDDENEDESNNGAEKNDVSEKGLDLQKQSAPPQLFKPDPSLPQVSLLRQPKCPDGTNGFKRKENT